MGRLGDAAAGLRSGSNIAVLSSVLTALLNTCAILLIARKMGPEMLGSLGLMLAYLGMGYFLGDMGWGLALKRVLAGGYGFGKVYRAFFLAKLKLTILLGIALGVLSAVYAYLLMPPSHTPLHPLSLAVMSGYFLTTNLAGLWLVVLAARRPGNAAGYRDMLEGAVKLGGVLAIIYLLAPAGDQEAVFDLAVVYLAAGTLGLMLARNMARGLKRGREDEEVVLEMQETAGYLVPYLAFMGVAAGLDKFLLWYFSAPARAMETVGLYFGAQRITIFIATSAVSVRAMLAPGLGRHVAAGDTGSAARLLTLSERYVSLVVMPMVAFYILFADDFPRIFLGGDFAGTGSVVTILAAGGLFAALATPHITYLLEADRHRVLAVSAGMSLLVLAAGLLLLLPPVLDIGISSMESAALSAALASLALYCTARTYVWKQVRAGLHGAVPRHVLSAGLMAVVLYFLVWYFGLDVNFRWLAAFAILGTLIYGLLLYLVGEMLRSEYREFRSLAAAAAPDAEESASS